MTSPNFLSHIQHTGFIPQPGIGDILGQQFQNLAQTRSVVREQDQRQQQIDQLGQYYQGQVNEMQRLRDQQEQAAIAERQRQQYLAVKMAELDKKYPIPENADARTLWEIHSKRALAMAEFAPEMAGPLSNVLNGMRPQQAQGDEFASSPQGIFSKRTGTITAPAPTKTDESKPMEVSPGGWVIKDGKVIFHAPDRPGSGAGGGAQEARDMAREEKIRNNWEQVTKDHTVRADQVRSIQASLDGARNMDPASQMAMIFAFMKLVDPRSSVREREYANAQNTAGVPDKVRNIYNKLLKGTILTPEQVEDFYRAALSQAAAGAKEVRRQREKFKGIAQRWRVNEDILDDPYTDVVPELDPVDKAKADAVRSGKRPTS